MERVRHLTPARASYTLVKKTSLVLEAIRFQESVFALPFAYTGMVLAAEGFPTWHQFTWITVAMVSARTLGMSANRIIDRQVDPMNPRTADRHLPRGRLRVGEMMALSAASLGVLLLAAAQLNALALALAPVAAAYLIVYPYTKRFTWAANLLLGWALAIAPSAAWIGVTGDLTWEPVVLSLAVALWAGSFDILYHIQDVEFYRRECLHSVAQRFGAAAAIQWARLLDAMAVGCLLALGIWMELGWPFYVGWAVAAALLAHKHRLVSPGDTSRLGLAFFRINAYVSITVFVGAFVAVLV